MSDFETRDLAEIDERLAKLSRLTVRQAASAITERHKAEMDALQRAVERQIEQSRLDFDRVLAQGQVAALQHALAAVVEQGFTLAEERLQRRANQPAVAVDGLRVTTVEASLGRDVAALLNRAAREAKPGELPVAVAGNLGAFDALRSTVDADRRAVLLIDLNWFLRPPSPRRR